MKKSLIFMILLVLFTLGCEKGPYVPDGAVGVHELEEKDMEGDIELYGQVTMKGVTDEGCFELTYVGKNVKICKFADEVNNGDRVTAYGKFNGNLFIPDRIEKK